MTFHVVLYQPEIPQNAGAVLRTCAATGSHLHLIGPLGFRLDAAGVRRAGMDYREWAMVRRWNDWAEFMVEFPLDGRLFVVTTKATKGQTPFVYEKGDWFLFGAEGSGLPPEILSAHVNRQLRIPMLPRTRSLNLAQSVAVVLYEALRQVGFPGME
ncbi:MAG: tRNA (cytidine(34)-2'-O)-methyltransferase [Magnetococcales bacterium]|nr:tRNA (cytidine(34)-2'-O)-methyltransferase [Magnetococcales bacterium]MBF0437986.1 tRNA (cytidine(34)-2'-O)-methyltransferase [Magnetococcales bacterium]